MEETDIGRGLLIAVGLLAAAGTYSFAESLAYHMASRSPNPYFAALKTVGVTAIIGISVLSTDAELRSLLPYAIAGLAFFAIAIWNGVSRAVAQRDLSGQAVAALAGKAVLRSLFGVAFALGFGYLLFASLRRFGPTALLVWPFALIAGIFVLGVVLRLSGVLPRSRAVAISDMPRRTGSYAVVFDTNVLRGLGDSAFAEVLAHEERLAITPLVDLWTLRELIAGLDSALQPANNPYVAALRRAHRRSRGQWISSCDAQIHRLLFGDTLQSERDSAEALLGIAEAVTGNESWHTDTDLREAISSVAHTVRDTEHWFAKHFDQTAATLRSRGGQERMREMLRSQSALFEDAQTTVRAAYQRVGRTPSDSLLRARATEVLGQFRPRFLATAMAFERVLCDGARLDNSRIRNLIWDQEIAHCIGQTHRHLPVILVTDDRLFKEVAVQAGAATSVLSTEEYRKFLGP